MAKVQGVGLLEYQQKGKITTAFYNDFKALCLKIYRSWRLQSDYDEFLGYCTVKLVERIGGFDPSKGNIGNYIYNMILNEARRVFSAEDHCVDSDVETSLMHRSSPEPVDIKAVWTFALYAYNRGIYVDQLQLLRNYQAEVMSPCCQAFIWLRTKGVV